jgi:uncharacterized membrane protein YuzA (DUF378 family)
MPMKLFSLLAVVGTILGLVGAAVALVRSLATGKSDRVRRIATASIGWCALYMIVLIGMSWATKEKIVPPNTEEQLGGFYLDRDLAVSVVGVDHAKTIGSGSHQLTAAGMFYIVKVRVRSTAKRATLELYDPQAIVVDTEGNRFERSQAAETVLTQAKGAEDLFVKSVGPGEEYTKDLVFDLPPRVLNPRLAMTEGDPVERFLALFLIGDEHSLLHKPVTLSLGR